MNEICCKKFKDYKEFFTFAFKKYHIEKRPDIENEAMADLKEIKFCPFCGEKI